MKSKPKAELLVRSTDSTSENARIDLPDTATLSYLAVQFRFNGATDKSAVSAALDLWREANTLLNHERNKQPFDPWKNYAGVLVPHPAKFPVSFQEMLRLLMPALTKYDERLARFRHYLANTPVTENGQPTGRTSGLNCASKRIEELKESGFKELMYWFYWQGFQRWWAKELARLRSEAGKKGGRKPK